VVTIVLFIPAPLRRQQETCVPHRSIPASRRVFPGYALHSRRCPCLSLTLAPVSFMKLRDCGIKGRQVNPSIYFRLDFDAGKGGARRTGHGADRAPHGRDLCRDCGRRRPRWPCCRAGALWPPGSTVHTAVRTWRSVLLRRYHALRVRG